MKKGRWEMPSDVLAVHREIETWRKNREKRGPIPSSIWLAASSLAKRYGVYRIAQTLHLHYGVLKRRLLEGKETDEAVRNPKKLKESKGSCEFVELTGYAKVSGDLPVAEPLDRLGYAHSNRDSSCFQHISRRMSGGLDSEGRIQQFGSVRV